MLIVAVHNRIKKYRKAKHITQEKLAKLVGCSETYINKLENNHVDRPSSDIIGKISYILGVSVAILFIFRVQRKFILKRGILKKAIEKNYKIKKKRIKNHFK